MAIVSDVEIRLRADIARLQQDMNRARGSVDSAIGRMSQAVDRFKSALAGIAAGGALLGLAKQAIDAQREFDKLNASLITATGSQEAAGRAFKALQQFAATTPYALADVTKAFLQLRNLGLTPSERALTSYGNTAAAMGKDLNQLIEAVADASTGEFERLKEFGIVSKKEGDKVAFTFQGVTTKVAQNAKDIENYLMALGETKFAGGMERQAQTLDGAISNLGDAWSTTMRAFNNMGFGDGVLDGVKAMSDALTDLSAIFDAITAASDKQATSLQETSALHKILTTVFEALSVTGINIAYIFRTLGKDIGGLARQVGVLFSGGATGLVDGSTLKAVQDIGRARVAEAEAERKEVDRQSEAIVGAAAKAKAVRDAEAAERAKNKQDRLAEFAIVTKGTKTQSDAEKKAAEERAKAYAALKLAVGEKIAESAREANGLGAVNEAQKMAIKLDAELASGKTKLTAAQEKEYRGLIATYDNNLRVIDSQDAAKKGAEDWAKISKELTDKRAADVKTAEDEATANEELARTFGLAKDKIEELELARLEEQYAQRISNGLTLDEVETLEKLIAAKIRSAKAIADVEDLKKQKDLWESIEKTAHDTFVSILDGGKDAATRLRDTFKNIFFEWLYQQTLKKWIIQLQPTTAGGGGGLSSITDAFSDNGGGVSGLMSAGKVISQGFSKGVSGSMGTMVSDLGKTFGSTAMQSFGSGMSGTAGAGATGAAGMGATAAKMIPVAGWIAAGMMANNKFFDQGWDMTGQINEIVDSQFKSMLKGNGLAPLGVIMTASAGISDKILTKLGMSAKVASMISGTAVWARAFGHKKAEIESQGVRGTASASGFSGESYANILQKGGWFRSDKRNTVTDALAAEQQKAFDQTITAMSDSVRGFGKALGAQVTAIDGYSKAIDLVLTNDEEKNKELIAAAFGGIADDLSLLLLPNIMEFAQGSETASAALQRVALDFQAVTAMLDMLGTTSRQAFNAVGTASIAARERLVALAGGLEAFAAQSDFFASNFLTSAQRMAPVQKQVADGLAELGYAGLSTVEQYSAAVVKLSQSGALATEAGAKTYAGLLALAPAFKQVVDYTDELTRSMEAAAAALAAENARQRQGMADLVDKNFAALERAVDAQKDKVTAAYQASMGELEKHIDSINESLTATRSLSQSLKSATSGMGLMGSEGASRMAAQAQITQALAAARATGVLPSVEDLQDALGALGRDPSNQFSSYADYARDVARTADEVSQLAEITDAQVSMEERQLAAMIAQRDADTLAYNAEIARLDSQVVLAQAQLDAINGVDTGVQTLVAAMAGLQAALAGLANPPSTNGSGVTSGLSVGDLYMQTLGRQADAAGLAYWTKAYGSTVDSAEIADFLKAAQPELQAKSAGAWGSWLSDKGVNAPVYSAQQSATMGDSSAVLTELQTLNKRMANVETSTKQFADQFDSVSAGGGPLLTTAAA